MSFSSEVKIELSKFNNLKNKKDVYAELLGYLSAKNAEIDFKKLKFSTENEYNINRFSKLLSNINLINFKLNFNGKIYTITDNEKSEKDYIKAEFNIYSKDINEQPELISEDEKKSYVRGCFMGGGTINNPNNNYHLEINFNNENSAIYVLNILNLFDIKAKLLNESNTLYIKESEEISKFLAFIGASKNVLEFEQVRVVREMKNNVNRLVNCETANMNKTISASVEQIANIKKLKKVNKFDLLPDDLKTIANLREKNPNATLEQLGLMLEKPIGKSSVNNRFKRIKLASDEVDD